MRRTRRVLIAVASAAALVFVLGAVPAIAQETSQIQGELVQVDTDARTLTVRTEAQEQMQFQYTDETQVTGAQDSIAGLAGERDARVTVHFREEAGVRTATQIEVQQAQQQ